MGYRLRRPEPRLAPDASSIIRVEGVGGLLEAKKIAALAELFYLPVCAHNVASPLGTVASAHCAAAIRDFRAQEFAPGTLPTEKWEQVATYEGPVIKDGKIRILDKPG
jgi:L-alanine-DL-glutamate epimerase-like enolase superfamily enzyme